MDLFHQNFNASPDEVNITIHGNFTNDDILKVYGYGREAATFNTSGDTIYISSNGKVDTKEYITLLVGFNKNTFATNNTINNEFAYYEQLNNNRESYNNAEKKQDTKEKYFSMFRKALIPGIIIIILLTFLPSLFKGKSNTNTERRIGGYLKCNFGPTGNELPKKVDYYRNIPNNGDIYRSFWIAGYYGIMNKREDFMGAILLKWLLNGNIKFNEENDIELVSFPNNDVVELENTLYGYFRGASEKNILRQESFKTWCMQNPSKIYHWFTDVIDYETVLLTKEGKAKFIKKEDEFHSVEYRIDEEMYEEASKLAGFKTFLNDFSMMETKEKLEVKLWKEYLIYAEMFGIADKISEEFKELYPELVEVIENSHVNLNSITSITTMSANIIKYAEASYIKSTAVSSGSSRGGSSGFGSSSGGSFSSGGGGGSFGGGGSHSSGGGFR